jgi:hypothetical protein
LPKLVSHSSPQGLLLLGIQRTVVGTTRVLAAVVLVKDEEGQPWRLDLDDLPAVQKEAVGFIAIAASALDLHSAAV